MPASGWIPIVFWVMSVGSCFVSGLGVFLRWPALLIIGAVLAIPLAFYVGGTLILPTIGYFLPLLLLAAAGVVKHRQWLAVMLLVPILWFTILLAHAVLTQPFRIR